MRTTAACVMVVGALVVGCAKCPAGEVQIFVDDDAYCGPPCPAGCGSCPSDFYCKQTVDGDRVCVDGAFLADHGLSQTCGVSGSTTPPSPTCGSQQVGVTYMGSHVCLDRCTSNADCATCCGRLSTGDLVCAPSIAECDGTATVRRRARAPTARRAWR